MYFDPFSKIPQIGPSKLQKSLFYFRQIITPDFRTDFMFTMFCHYFNYGPLISKKEVHFIVIGRKHKPRDWSVKGFGTWR